MIGKSHQKWSQLKTWKRNTQNIPEGRRIKQWEESAMNAIKEN